MDEALWQLALEGSGLSPHEDGLWRDAPDTVGAVIADVGVFVGWIDVTGPAPASPSSGCAQ